MNPIEAKFHRWLRRVKRGGSGRLVLGHVDVAGRGAQLGEWPLRDEDTNEALEQVTLDVMQVANDDTDGQAAQTPQQYLALYYTEDSPTDAYSRFKFRLAPPQLQGLTRPWSLDLDFGATETERAAIADAPRLRLLLTGWLQWGDASVNMAAARDPEHAFVPPIVWVPDGDNGWRPIGPPVGFPAGKTKTLVVDR